MKMKVVCLMLAVGLAGMAGCMRPEESRRVLESNGYKNVVITGWEPLVCGDDDMFSTGFIAEKDGHKVQGVVCSGLLKGSTVRFK